MKDMSGSKRWDGMGWEMRDAELGVSEKGSGKGRSMKKQQEELRWDGI